jgi:Acetyl-CoA dehydrogenase C-terminal like
VAHDALASDGDALSAKDRDFYTGKVAAARFFARTVLPRLSAERAIAEGTDASIMDVPESAF